MLILPLPLFHPAARCQRVARTNYMSIDWRSICISSFGLSSLVVPGGHGSKCAGKGVACRIVLDPPSGECDETSKREHSVSILVVGLSFFREVPSNSSIEVWEKEMQLCLFEKMCPKKI